MIQRRRKTTPTYHERMIWGQGDGSGLRVVDSKAAPDGIPLGTYVGLPAPSTDSRSNGIAHNRCAGNTE